MYKQHLGLLSNTLHFQYKSNGVRDEHVTLECWQHIKTSVLVLTEANAILHEKTGKVAHSVGVLLRGYTRNVWQKNADGVCTVLQDQTFSSLRCRIVHIK